MHIQTNFSQFCLIYDAFLNQDVNFLKLNLINLPVNQLAQLLTVGWALPRTTNFYP